MRVIADFEKFEDSATRRVKRLTWVKLPTKIGIGFRRLTKAHPDGWSHYGIWCRLLAWLGSREDRDWQIPDDATVALMLDAPEDLVAAALARLEDPAIGWIVSGQHPGNIRATSGQHPGNIRAAPGSPQENSCLEKEKDQDQDQDQKKSATARKRSGRSPDDPPLTADELARFRACLDVHNAQLELAFSRHRRQIAEECKRSGEPVPITAATVRDCAAARRAWRAAYHREKGDATIKLALTGNAWDVWHLARGKHDWPYVLRDGARGNKLHEFAEKARRAGWKADPVETCPECNDDGRQYCETCYQRARAIAAAAQPDRVIEYDPAALEPEWDDP